VPSHRSFRFRHTTHAILFGLGISGFELIGACVDLLVSALSFDGLGCCEGAKECFDGEDKDGTDPAWVEAMFSSCQTIAPIPPGVVTEMDVAVDSAVTSS
jgi:hypothetical protein